jgi:SAM-dependent methyltransferase
MKIRFSRVDSFGANFSRPELLTARPCPICRSTRDRRVFSYRDFQFYSDSAQIPKRVDLHIRQCSRCLALYLNPTFSVYGYQILFEEAGRSYGSSESRQQEQVTWLGKQGLLRTGSRLLDVGCHDGRFLAKLPSDMKKVGADISESGIEKARSDFSGQETEFFLTDFESFEYQEPIDTFTLFHVLEHLKNPVNCLQKLHRLATKKAFLVVEVPVIELARSPDINGFFSVHHTTHFSKHSLANCLAMGGWTILNTRQYSEHNGYRVLAQASVSAPRLRENPDESDLLEKNLTHWDSRIAAISKRLAGLKSIDRCVVWGGGTHTEIIYHTTDFFRTNPGRDYIVVDGDPAKHAKSWRGIPIVSPSVLSEQRLEHLPLLISSFGSQGAIENAALMLGVSPNRISKLYPD